MILLIILPLLLLVQAKDLAKMSGGLIPAISFESSMTFRFNTGITPFRYAPPSLSHRSLARYVRKIMEETVIATSGALYGQMKVHSPPFEYTHTHTHTHTKSKYCFMASVAQQVENSTCIYPKR